MIPPFFLFIICMLVCPTVGFSRSHGSRTSHVEKQKKTQRLSSREAKLKKCMETDAEGDASDSVPVVEIVSRDIERPQPTADALEYAKKRGWDLGKSVGYVNKEAFPITTVQIDTYGKYPVELNTAIAFDKMARSASKKGIVLALNSGFRTNEEQKKLRMAWCARKRKAIAAVPGRSLHQAGYALDINMKNRGVMRWLNKHAHEFQFYRTVCSESWHWEFSPTGEPLPMRYACMSKRHRGRIKRIHQRALSQKTKDIKRHRKSRPSPRP